MARDLIPPVSPAGRPAPDGTPNLIELPPEMPPVPSEPAPPPGPSAFRNRFGFLFGALAGVFIAATLILVTVIATSRDADDAGLAPNWSRWHPTDPDDVNRSAAEIAAKVGAEYFHPNGQQLALVRGGELSSGVALQPAEGPLVELDGTGVVYQFDGLGPNGSIQDGTPSTNRAKVIQREALELALYTFRYVPDVDMVVSLLPPPRPTAEERAAAAQAAAAGGVLPDDRTRHAIFYRPGDLKPQLQVPLGHTLSATAPKPGSYGGPEVETVDLLTSSNVFKWTLSDREDLLVLKR